MIRFAEIQNQKGEEDGDDEDDDDDDDSGAGSGNDDAGSVMTSYLLVGYQADRGNPDKRKSKGPQRSENHTAIDRLISWKDDLNGGTVTLPMSGAP